MAHCALFPDPIIQAQDSPSLRQGMMQNRLPCYPLFPFILTHMKDVQDCLNLFFFENHKFAASSATPAHYHRLLKRARQIVRDRKLGPIFFLPLPCPQTGRPSHLPPTEFIEENISQNVQPERFMATVRWISSNQDYTKGGRSLGGEILSSNIAANIWGQQPVTAPAQTVSRNAPNCQYSEYLTYSHPASPIYGWFLWVPATNRFSLGCRLIGWDAVEAYLNIR